MSDRVSVIIPTYNRAHYILRALKSVIKAVEPGDEIIVVDDGSEDETESVLEKYKHLIRYIKTDNGGAGRARNIGIELAANPLISFLDSDDEWVTDHLLIHRQFLANSDVLFSFSNFDLIDDTVSVEITQKKYLVNWTQDNRSWDKILGNGEYYSKYAVLPKGREDFMVHTGNLYKQLIHAPYVPAWTSLIQKNLAGDNLKFAEDFKTYEDWECYVKLSGIGNCAYLDCSTAINHGHRGFRLTGADNLIKSTTRIAMMGRLWGNDQDYLKNNRDIYDKVMEEQKIIRIKRMIALGETSSARKEIENIDKLTFIVKVSSYIPGDIIKIARSIYKYFRKLILMS